MNQRNLLRSLYAVLTDLGVEKRGFHAFCRYRNTFLRNAVCPDGLLKYWLGHAGVDMSDRNDRVCDDMGFRRDAAAAYSIGFGLPKTLTPRKVKRPNVGEAVGPERPILELSGVIGRQAEAVPEVSP